MSRVYAIADLHFGHALLAKLRGFSSTEDHDAALVDAWNSVVTKRDVVYVLGDIFRLEPLAKLKGIKKLAMGNHDQYQPERYAEHFSQVRSCFQFDGCLLTHIPVHPSQFRRYELNVHGHTHEHTLTDQRYLSVSVEQLPDRKPVLLGQIINERRKLLASKPFPFEVWGC